MAYPMSFPAVNQTDIQSGRTFIRLKIYFSGATHVLYVLPRLDARYDWLPSATSTFGDKWVLAFYVM